MNKKLLIVGSDKVFAIENFYLKYSVELGKNVTVFPAFTLFVDHYRKNILNAILFKIGLSKIYARINQKFREIVEQTSPDIILVFKGMEISASSLAFAKQRGIKLVNYNPDNPFIFSGKGSGNSNVTKSIGLYDLHLTYDHLIKTRLEEEYHLKAGILPFGFDDHPELFEECRKEAEIIKLCFVGNPDANRAAVLRSLAQSGIAIDVYGFGWSRFLNEPGITIHQAVLGAETWKTLRKYRVQLNIMRVHNEASHNMRSFEVPGIGGIMLAPDTADHRLYFDARKEAFLYKDIPGCVKLAKELLEMPASQADQIRQAARQRSISSGYSYRDRTRQLWEYLDFL